MDEVSMKCENCGDTLVEDGGFYPVDRDGSPVCVMTNQKHMVIFVEAK
jgi:hypothetical protein